jgi:hypothetical protein
MNDESINQSSPIVGETIEFEDFENTRHHAVQTKEYQTAQANLSMPTDFWQQRRSKIHTIPY